MRANMSDFVLRLRGRRTRLIDRQLVAVQAWLEGLELLPRRVIVRELVGVLFMLAFGISFGVVLVLAIS